MIYIYPYNKYSKSAKMLASEMKVPLLTSVYSLSDAEFSDPRNVLINWGCGDLPRHIRHNWNGAILNNDNAVYRAINKIQTMRVLGDLAVPNSTNYQDGYRWIDQGFTVVCRDRVEGRDGEGVRLARTHAEIGAPKMITKFIRAEREYRITVCNGEFVCAQRKVRVDKEPETGYNDDIKTSSNGYGFKWVTQNIPPAVINVSVGACSRLGLTFGGVDAIWDGRRAYVLEVNTASELTPLSCSALARALRRYITNNG